MLRRPRISALEELARRYPMSQAKVISYFSCFLWLCGFVAFVYDKLPKNNQENAKKRFGGASTQVADSRTQRKWAFRKKSALF